MIVEEGGSVWYGIAAQETANIAAVATMASASGVILYVECISGAAVGLIKEGSENTNKVQLQKATRFEISRSLKSSGMDL
jgi:hypothetical protein